MGKAQTQPVYPRGVGFEQVWAALQETDRIVKEVAESQKETDRILKENAERQKESQKETDRIIKENAERQKETDRQIKESQKENAERQKETDRQIKESQKETDRIIKENAERQRETDRQIKDFNKRFGEFTNRFGEVVEYMIAPNLREKFRELGLNFPKANSNSAISDVDNQIFLEIDVVLENGEKAMLVEVKTKLAVEDVKDHVKRLEKMRVYADLHGDKRSFLGAVAGVVMTSHVKKYALERGFYVIEPSGETFTITPPADKSGEW
jgi:chromosome segregation ATPase